MLRKDNLLITISFVLCNTLPLHAQEHQPNPSFLAKAKEHGLVFCNQAYRGFKDTLKPGAIAVGATSVAGIALAQMGGDATTSQVYAQSLMTLIFRGMGGGIGMRRAGLQSGLLTPEIKPIFYTKDATGTITLKSELILPPAAPEINIEGPASELLEKFKIKIFTIAESDGQFANGNDPSDSRVVGALLYGTPGVGKTLASQILARDLAAVSNNPSIKNAWYKGKKPVIFRVTQSQITNPYVGMSNKLRDRIQADMKELSEAGYLPFLLFDEADQFFATTGKTVISSEDHQTSGWKDRLEKDLSRYAILMAASNKRDLDRAIKDRFTYSEDVSPKDKQEWAKIINVSAENIIQSEFSEDAHFELLKVFLKTSAVKFAEKLPADSDEKEKKSSDEMTRLATPRKFNSGFSEIVKATLKIAREYNEKGIPLESAPSSGKQEKTDSQSTGATGVLENIYARALAENTLSKSTPNPTIRRHIQTKLSEKNPTAAPSVVMKQSRDLAYLIDWAVEKSDDPVSVGKKLFDESFTPAIPQNPAHGGEIYDAEDPLLPTILAIVAKSGKAADTHNPLSPVKTLISAYHGMPAENDTLNMVKSLNIISHIEAAENENASDSQKFNTTKKDVRKSITSGQAELTALAGLTIGNLNEQYKKVVPHSDKKRTITAPLYQANSALSAQDVATFYQRATLNNQFKVEIPESKSLN